ncbi:hypothetical protein N9M16_05725, partial [Candidatus Dependentiae bacterium]|nr:hypothetical protein [Candidatus Dependentiae bacterium]
MPPTRNCPRPAGTVKNVRTPAIAMPWCRKNRRSFLNIHMSFIMKPNMAYSHTRSCCFAAPIGSAPHPCENHPSSYPVNFHA